MEQHREWDFDHPDVLEALRQRDLEVWDALVTQMREPLRRWLTRLMAGDPNGAQEVDDLAQETWNRAWRSISGFRGECKVKTWVFTIAERVVQDHVTKDRTQRQRWDAVRQAIAVGLAEPHQRGEDPATQLQLRQLAVTIEQGVARLSARQRQVLLAELTGAAELRHLQDVMGRGNVSTTLFHAKAILEKLVRYADRHLAEEVFLYSRRNAIPAGPSGLLLHERIIWHPKLCALCHARSVRDPVQFWHWTGGREPAEQLARVQQFVEQLKTLALLPVSLSPQTGGVAPTRDGIAPQVTAWVFDHAGQFVVDSEGEPRSVPFEVLDAQIDQHRGLQVQLLTDAPPYAGPGNPVGMVQVALHHHVQRLCFPAAVIYPQRSLTSRPVGIATVQAALRLALEVQLLPTEALRLTVHPYHISQRPSHATIL